jgi:hypothetical protein
MSKSRLFAIAVVWLTGMTVACADDMKCPNAWARMSTMYARFPQSAYLHCDYTTRTCERGHRVGNTRVFELLAEDRTTVIGHFYCGDSGGCLDFDRGLAISPAGTSTSTVGDPARCG